MQEYINQLLVDIANAIDKARFYFPNRPFSYHEWLSETEEESSATEHKFDEWTGIRKILLPPEVLLNDDEVEELLDALVKLICAYHLDAYFFYTIPDRLKYSAIRENFDQTVKALNYRHGTFEFCKKGTPIFKCALGAYCHCGFTSGSLSDTYVDFVFPGREKNLKTNGPEIYKIERIDTQ